MGLYPRTYTATINDKDVTNAKLADDVKVGSLAALTTTNQTSVTAAINEVDAHADAAQSTASAKYTKPAGGIPGTDLDATAQAKLAQAAAAMVGGAAVTAIRIGEIQLNGHGITPVAFKSSTSAYLVGSADGSAGFNFVANGKTFIARADEDGGDTTATFAFTYGKHTGGGTASTDISTGEDNKLNVAVDADVGVTSHEIALTLAGLISGAAIATEITAKIQAIGGIYAAVVCTFSVDHYVITSGTAGTGSKVRVTDAATDSIANELDLGTDNGGTNTDGTGDGANMVAVTLQEVVNKLNTAFAAKFIASIDNGKYVKLTSTTTGKDSRLLISNGTANAILGFTNTQADYGMQGLGNVTDMNGATYIVMVGMVKTAAPTTYVSVGSRTAAKFTLYDSGGTATDYVMIAVFGVPA